MSAKDFTISHGEKIVVALVGGLCIWAVIDAKTDPGIRPKEAVSLQGVQETFANIDKLMKTGTPPLMKPIPDYLGLMKGQMSRALSSPALPAWLTVHPDVGPVDPGASFIYVYELTEARINAVDAIGSIELSLKAGDLGAADPARRVSSAPRIDWTRNDGSGSISNNAEILGVQVQVRVGDSDADWQPLVGKGVGPDGILPWSAVADGRKFSIPPLEAWAVHSFRARLLVKASAYADGGSVLVRQGRFVAPGENGLKELGQLAADLKRDPELAQRPPFVRSATAPLPTGVSLKSRERVFAQPWEPAMPVTTIPVTAEIRWALDKVVPDPANPSAMAASFLVTKLFRTAAGNVWMDKPWQFKVPVGGAIGTEVEMVPPGSKDGKRKPVDLTTGFELVEIKQDVERTQYYEIREKPRQGGGKGKDLEIFAKTRKTIMVVLRNKNTGTTMQLVKLDRIVKPANPRIQVYPSLFSENYDEIEEFRQSPVEFRQFGLVPASPRLEQPGQGPLEELFKTQGDPLLKTDTPYVVMPDGRILWWEPRNSELRTWEPPGFQRLAKPPKAEKPEAAEVPVEAPKGGAVPPVKPTETHKP